MNRLFLLLFGMVTLAANAQVPDYVPTEGLVAWYPFNGNANDESGNANHGVESSNANLMPSFVYDSHWNREVIEFDDVDDELTVLAPSQLGVGNEFTFSTWLIPNEQNHGQVMSMDAGRFSFFLHGANDHFDAQSSTSWASQAYYCGWNNHPYVHPDGWFHMTITISSDSIKAFGNGQFIAGMDCGGQSTFDTNIIFGYRNMNSSGDYHWGGRLADCGMWNRALTQEEIQALYSATYDGIDSGPTSLAGLFDGDDYIWLTDADFLNFGQSSFTAHVQFRANDLSSLNECCGYQTLIAKGSSGGTGRKGFNLDLRGEPEDARIKCNLSTAPGVDVILNAPITEDEWYDLVFIVDWSAEVASLYVNGTFVSDGSLEGLGNMNNAWYPSIGRFVWDNDNQNDAHFFRGEIALMRILEGADYDLGQSPCSDRENVLFEIAEFTAEEVQAQVSSSFAVDEVVTTAVPCGNSSVPGCTDPTACNFDAEANENDGSCISSGCMEPLACNYNALAECEGEACDYTCCPGPGCCSAGMYWDYDLEQCMNYETCEDDLDGDGVIGVNDLMQLLSSFGTDCPELGEPETAEFMCGDPVNYHGYDYATVQIGEQCWFAENLRTEFYQSGDPIPGNLSNSEWSNTHETSLGAQAIYNNDPLYLESFGRLYNGHAVLDDRNLCPNGWHVGSDEDWEILEQFVSDAGYTNQEGLALKSTSTWNANGGQSGNGIDAFGFAAVANGSRSWTYGTYNFAGIYGQHWTSTPIDATQGYRRSFRYDDDIFLTYPGSLNTGASVRCLADE